MKALGFPKVILEGDSLNIRREAKDLSKVGWTIEELIKEGKIHLDKLDEVIIQHTYREGN
ncbi:MAG: reverse transcriptase-like protein [Planctomycetes bacterium]|nr:reverse transcriptase-like protein [Planctomycetota bacterium]